MRYHVYRKKNDQWIETATTEFIEDARSILDNWYAGYIAYNGDIINKKRCDF